MQNKNDNFYIVPLTSAETGNGAISDITEALNAAFQESTRVIRNQGLHGEAEEMIVLVDSQLTNVNFAECYGDQYQNVLYINDPAKDAIEKAGVDLKITHTNALPPENANPLSFRVYRFINLH